MKNLLMKRLLPLCCFLFLIATLSAQTTYNFSSSPPLATPSPLPLNWPSTWKTWATPTIGGVEYLLNGGINGTWTYKSTGGNGNSGCLQKDGSGGDDLTITRKDGAAFQFYGIWLKHSSMYYQPFYFPPYYTITYTKVGSAAESFVYPNTALSTTETYAKNLAVTSVNVHFTSMMYYWIDDLIVGPAIMPPTVTTSKTNITCNGGSNGSATVSASGGTAPYTYSWSPSGGTTSAATGLTAGAYTCTITDAVGTAVTKNFTLSQPAAIAVSAVQTNLTCYGGTNGAATVTPSGGTTPYTYSWSPSGGTAATASNLSAGTYVCTITSANTCSTTKSITITQPAEIVATPTPATAQICSGAATSIVLSSTPSGSSYTWTVSAVSGTVSGAVAGSGTSIAQTLTGSGVVNYIVSATNGSCPAATVTLPITVNAAPAITANPANKSADAQGNASFSITATGATSYQWQENTGSGYFNLSNSSIYSGVAGSTLSLSGISTVMNGYAYRCIVTGSCSPADYSYGAILSTKSNNSTLSSINIGQGTLTPVFSPGTKSYSVTVAPGVSLFSLNPSSGDPTAILKINGQTAASGTAVDLALAGGVNTFTVLVTAEDGITTSAYIINVTRPFLDVESIQRAQSAVTNDSEREFTLAFSDTITGLSADNLSLTANGTLSGETIKSVALVSPGIYTVTVSTGSGDGQLFLNVANDLGLSARVKDLPYIGKDGYIVDRTVPVAKSKNISATLGSNGVATINPADLNDGSEDNQSGAGQIVYTASKTSFISADLGKHTIDFTATDEAGNSNTVSVVVTVVKNVSSVAGISPLSVSYGDSLHVPAQVLITYSDMSTELVTITWSLQGYAGKAGAYEIEGTFPASPYTTNSEVLKALAQVTVAKRNLVIALQGSVEKVYDSEDDGSTIQSNFSSNKLTADDLSIEGEVKYANKNAGTGKTVTVSALSITGADADNYILLDASVSASVGTITQRNLLVSLDGFAEKVYDGSKAATLYSGNFQTDALKGDDISVAASAVYDTKDTGTNKRILAADMVVSGEDAGNYMLNFATVEANIGVITPKSVTAILKNTVSKSYDGTRKAILVPSNYELSGTLNGESVSLNNPVTGIYDSKQKGNNKKVTVNDLLLTGADAPNYSLASNRIAEEIGVILAKNITVSLSAVPSVTKIYDGDTQAALLSTNYVLSGVEDGDLVTVSGEAAYDSRQAGTNKTVHVTGFILGESDADNYKLSTLDANVTGVITAKQLVLSLAATPVITKVYDGNALAEIADENIQLAGITAGDKVSVTVEAAYDNKSAGSLKTVTADNFILVGADRENYSLTSSSETVQGTITAKPVSAALVSTPEITKPYDGESTAFPVNENYTLSGIEDMDDVHVAGSATYENTSSGTDKTINVINLQLTGEDKYNYSLTNNSALVTGSITKREITITLNHTIPFSKTYDGNPSATLEPGNYTLSGVLQYDELSVEGVAVFDNKNAGNSKIVKASSFVLSGKYKDQYKLTTIEASDTGSITPKDIGVTVNAEPQINKIYDGANSVSLKAENYTLTEVVNGDEVSVKGRAYFENAYAGSDKSISVSQFILEGADRNNYHLLADTKTTSGRITPKELTVSLQSAPAITKIYDGNTIAALDKENYVLSGIVADDDVTLNNPESGIYDDKHAGENKNITVPGLAISGNAVNNYSLSAEYTTAAIGTIIPRLVSVTALPVTKIYGTVDPALSYEVTGLLDGEELRGMPARDPGKNTGVYAIAAGSLNGGADYAVSEFTPSVFTITPADLEIRAEDKSRNRGEVNPAFTFSYTGLAEGDAASDLTVAPSAFTSAASGSPIGFYEIVASGAASPNYTISFVAGKLTILPSNKDGNNNLKAWSSAPGVIQVKLFVETDQKVGIILHSDIGQPIIVYPKQLKAGINTFTLPVGHLSSSYYIISVSAEKFKVAERIDVRR